MRLYGQAVKTPPSHGGNPGSNPGRVTTSTPISLIWGFCFAVDQPEPVPDAGFLHVKRIPYLRDPLFLIILKINLNDNSDLI